MTLIWQTIVILAPSFLILLVALGLYGLGLAQGRSQGFESARELFQNTAEGRVMSARPHACLVCNDPHHLTSEHPIRGV